MDEYFFKVNIGFLRRLLSGLQARSQQKPAVDRSRSRPEAAVNNNPETTKAAVEIAEAAQAAVDNPKAIAEATEAAVGNPEAEATWKLDSPRSGARK